MRDNRVIEQPVRLENLTLKFTNEAVHYIQSITPSSPPFFLFFSYVKVHTALFTSKMFKGVSEAGEYGDNVEELDWSVSKVFEAIHENQHISNNTIIFFTSDNGPFLEEGEEGGSAGYATMASGDQQYLKGGKGQNWEGGIRVPFFVSFPPFISHLENNDVISQMDIFPTILDLSNHPPITDRVIDGVNLLPKLIPSLLSSNESKERRNTRDTSYFDDWKNERTLFHYCGTEITAMRKGDLKLHFSSPIWDDGVQHCQSIVICECEGNRVINHSPPLLFNLTSDVAENFPIHPNSDQYLRFVPHLLWEKENQELAINSSMVTNQLLYSFPLPWLMPCCNPPFCECKEDD